MDIDYSESLPDEILATMPANMTAIDEFAWRQSALKKYKLEQQKKMETGGSSNDTAVSTTPSVIEPTVESSNQEASIGNNTSDVTIANSTETVSGNIPATPVKKTRPARSKQQTTRSNKDFEQIKSVSSSVMNAIRKRFPENLSKADLLAAFVYLHTGGDCEISDTAKQAVRNHKDDKDKIELLDRLKNIERTLVNQTKTLQAVELCTNFNTFDRFYGTKESRTSPSKHEFREQGSLNMLARLRQQASDQQQLDNMTEGRKIYNQTKDKGDE